MLVLVNTDLQGNMYVLNEIKESLMEHYGKL